MSDWRSVFDAAVKLARQEEPVWSALRHRLDCLPDDGPVSYQAVYYHPPTKTAFASRAVGPLEAVLDSPGLVAVPGEAKPPGWGREPWMLVKRAYEMPSLGRLGGWDHGGVSDLFGGPTPLAATLASGLLGAGVGYGAGWLGEKLLPAHHFHPGRLRLTAALAGLGLGAAPGLWWGSLEQRSRPHENMYDVWTKPKPEFRKTSADYFGTGIDDIGRWPPLQREGIVQAVWQDQNTPEPLRAATVGLLDSAAQSRGSNLFTVGDIARVAVNIGAGYAAGSLAGRVLGVLAGLRPEAQQKLQEAGVWAGVINSAISPVYRS